MPGWMGAYETIARQCSLNGLEALTNWSNVEWSNLQVTSNGYTRETARSQRFIVVVWGGGPERKI